uniref:Uncharacterized protein n=1 Tax=Romanomermis culicivorax TaxID=13658 RepID=A0A915KDE1_ROMCU
MNTMHTQISQTYIKINWTIGGDGLAISNASPALKHNCQIWVGTLSIEPVSNTTSKQKGSNSSNISQRGEVKVDPVNARNSAAPITASNNNINNMAVAKELLTADDRDAQIMAPIDRRLKLAKDHIDPFDQFKEKCFGRP